MTPQTTDWTARIGIIISDKTCCFVGVDEQVPDEEPWQMTGSLGVDRQAIHDEMERARAGFRQFLSTASEGDLHRRSSGTRWTNEQLLFHMLFGYLIVRALLVLVRGLSRLPNVFSRAFARLLNSATRPFHLVNYVGSCIGPRVFSTSRLAIKFDRVVSSLHVRLAGETEAALNRRMHFPTGWDPFFKDAMSISEVYHYATQHYESHRDQLTM